METKITSGTIARIIVLAIALINQIFAMGGYAPFDIDDSAIYQGVTLLATISSSLWAAWKNNSFTKEALKADQLLAELRARK
jgi:SPP1 family holin